MSLPKPLVSQRQHFPVKKLILVYNVKCMILVLNLCLFMLGSVIRDERLLN